MTGRRRYDAADHDRISGDAAALIAAEVIKAGGNSGNMMVVLESTVLGILLYSERRLGIERNVTVERIELMVTRIYERLADHDARQGAGSRAFPAPPEEEG